MLSYAGMFWSTPQSDPESRTSTYGAEKEPAATSSSATFLSQQQLDAPVTQGNTATTSAKQVVDRARRYARTSTFLKTFLALKRSVLTYGMKLEPAMNKGKEPADADRDKLDAWLDEVVSVKFEPYLDQTSGETIEPEALDTNRGALMKLIHEAWNDRLLLDCSIAIWADDWNYALVIPWEKCRFEDVLNVPILRYTHGLSEAQIALLPKNQQEIFKGKTEIVINAKEKMHFKVLKKAKTGDGLGRPEIESAFMLFGEVENKEIGFYTLSAALRRVTRQHKVGTVISGAMAHLWVKWMRWRPELDKSIKNAWVDKDGLIDFTSESFHEILFPWPDLKQFDVTAWQGTNERLMEWGGMLARLITSKGLQPYVPTLMRAEYNMERQAFAEFAQIVINNAYQPPVPIKLTFSDQVFTDQRLLTEMVKFAFQAGGLSSETMNETFGFHDQTEQNRKLAEADNADAQKLRTPIWDASHGMSPALGETAASMAKLSADAKATGANPGAKNGKPPGTSDTPAA